MKVGKSDGKGTSPKLSGTTRLRADSGHSTSSSSTVLPRSTTMKFSHKNSDEGSTTLAVWRHPAGCADLSRPTTLDAAADCGKDQRSRPAEHQRTARGSQRAKDAVARR